MNMAETVKGLGETLAQLIETLAGKGTNLQLTFKDLTLETAGMKTTLNGSIQLDILYVSQKKWNPLPTENPQQTLTRLIQTLKHGEITLTTTDVEALQIKIQDNTLDINILQKQPLQTILKQQTPNLHLNEVLKNLKNLAEQLKHNNITIKISYKNQPTLTLGAQAHPTITQIITGTNAIQINNLTQLTQLLT